LGEGGEGGSSGTADADQPQFRKTSGALANRMQRGSGWGAMVMAMGLVGCCQTGDVQYSKGARILTRFEMDQVTAGSAVAVNTATALALGSEPQTAALGMASAYFGSSPVAGAPFLNYATSQSIASASRGELSESALSSQISIDSVNGGASVGVTAAGTGTSRAQVVTQFYGVSTNRADVVFGSVTAGGCCGSEAAAQVEVNSRTGGPYSVEIRGAPVSGTPGEAQRRVDIAVASSALPILDPAQVLLANAPTRITPKY
jgi:hypothetical protein